jgi:hypothetical protein
MDPAGPAALAGGRKPRQQTSIAVIEVIQVPGQNLLPA